MAFMSRRVKNHMLTVMRCTAEMKQDLIFDIGLHKGEDSELYLAKGFRVVAVEAMTELCEFARNRLRHYIENGQLTIINAAIAEQSGSISLFVNEDKSDWGTTSLEWARRNEKLGTKWREVVVPAIKFGDLLHEYGTPYYTKIDIEGADLLCLKGFLESEEKPRFVSIESTKSSLKAVLEEFRLFAALGYSRFKVVAQHRIRSQTCPFPPKEGQYVDYKFEKGSSGLFGEEVPGPWLSEAEALEKYRLIFWKYLILGDDGLVGPLRRTPLKALVPFGGWYDTHATI
jgi:FkbM family methyltransferase